MGSGCGSTRSAPRSSSATAMPRSSARSRSRAARWNVSRRRCGTSSTPRSARSRSHSGPARRVRARCPTSATRSCPSGSPAWPGSCAGTPWPRSRTSRCGTSATSATAHAERVLLPDATILLDYMLVRMTGLVEGLVVRPERMRENIERGLGLHASSRVLVALVEDGRLDRDEAYGIVQRCALRAADERRGLRDLLATEPVVARNLSLSQLDACFDDAAFLRHVPDDHRSARPDRRSLPDDPDRRLRPLRQGPRPVRARRRPPAARRLRPDCRRSTSSCPRRSRTRAGSSPGCPGSGSPRPGRLVPNHLLGTDPADLPGSSRQSAPTCAVGR